MNIYLKHPVHGNKVATMELEAAFDELHGWTRYNTDEPVYFDEPKVENELRVKRKYTRRADNEGK
jgi:hypothetical protein